MPINVPQDSLVSLADANAYHELRQTAAVWGAFDDVERERRLVSASDYLDANYRLKSGLNAAMRAGGIVPQAVVKAVCELAVQSQLNADRPPKQQSVKVGEIAVTYALDAASKERFAYVAALLADLLVPGSAVKTVPMPRG